MNLSDVQRKILHAVVANASASEMEIARTLEIRHHIVRRTIDMFLEKQVFIQRSAFVNPYALGLNHEAMHISLPLTSQKHYTKFRNLLASCEEAVAVIEHGGACQVELRTYTRSPAHLQAFLDSLAKTFPHPFRIHSSLTILEQEYYGVPDPDVSPKMRTIMGYAPLASGATPARIDERDHTILSALCNAKYLNWSQLAHQLEIPTSTLSYRVGVLEKAGIIQGHYYVVDVTVFNDLPLLLNVSSKVMTQEERLALKKFCRLHPKVSWMSTFFGVQSAEMLVRVKSHDEARAVIADVSQHFGNVIDAVHLTSPLKFFKWSDYPFKSYTTLTGS